jgi:hypothetical protein
MSARMPRGHLRISKILTWSSR